MNNNSSLACCRSRNIFWIHRVIGFVFLSLILLINVGTSNAGSKITLQLAWKHQFQFAGYYAALHKGYYQQAGLDVTIIEGGVGKFAREEVLNGSAQYGIAGSELLLHRKDGEPFVVLAPIFQHSPSILLVRKNSGISNLQDLIGKKVMILPGKKDADILASFLNEGISLDAFERKDQTYNLADLIEGRTDAVSAYVTNEPWLLSQEGVEPMVISPQVYGVDFYSDCLFTTENEIAKHPEEVQSFLNASLLGWQYAMAHPEEMINLLQTHYGVNKKRDHLRFEAESIEKIMLPLLVEIGHTNPGRWHHIAKTYEKLGLIDADFSLEGFLYDPQHKADYRWFKKMAFTFLGVIILVCTGGGVLLYFNRKLAAEVEERKHAEKEIILEKQKAERYLQIASVMFIGINADGRVSLANEKACIILECSEEDIIGKKWFDNFIPETNRNDVRSVFNQLMNGDTKLTGYYENTVLSQKGTEKNIAWQNTYIMDDNGEIVGILCSGEDVSENKKLQKQLLQSQKMESIGCLAGGIAHDFNNILASILGFSELALDEVDKGSVMEDNLQEIYVGGLRAKEIVKQILAFARQSDVAKEPTRVDTIILEALKLIRPSTPTTIEIRQEISSSSLVISNAIQIHQVIMNLCTNAAHAMQDNGGIMKVSLNDIFINEDNKNISEGLKKGQYIELVISDTGCGIAPENIGSIFEPYFTTKATGEGTGMGLAMVRGIIDSYGGAIIVESIPSIQTVFTIYLPVTSNLQDTVDSGEEAPLAGGDEFILFVDDEPPIARMGSRILENLGYTVTSRTSSLEALELFKEKPDRFALVITDMTMPHMTGDKFAMELKQIREDIRIILCTGYSSKISAEIAHDIGIDAFTYKPFSKTDLGSTVREVLDKA